MKTFKLAAVLFAIAFFISFCSSAKKVKTDGSVLISGVLKDAKCPLSNEQATKLKEFKPGGGRGAFRAIYEVFDENQLNALKVDFGSSQGRGGRPERPRFLFFAVMFENENCPLTVEQLTALKALPNERGAFQQMGSILTEKQSALLQGMFNR